ncbi:hypothetical protein P171DRAFT_23712 [Karstenula rhodostoma CBS 690.94]|uniref:Uncharacterized protein n=1 Tax=Karstenula rhodostoma CBS 690.94 TaxID=1392251 RepID=A0A9P4PFC0_9PLEO|nr:hypothetical protein P171DRAFT_23712 [Karstenula rhodostoma CBS 690.94]
MEGALGPRGAQHHVIHALIRTFRLSTHGTTEATATLEPFNQQVRSPAQRTPSPEAAGSPCKAKMQEPGEQSSTLSPARYLVPSRLFFDGFSEGILEKLTADEQRALEYVYNNEKRRRCSNEDVLAKLPLDVVTSMMEIIAQSDTRTANQLTQASEYLYVIGT